MKIIMRRITRAKSRKKVSNGGIPLEPATIVERLEGYLRENPVKVLVQAGAVGCALRALPLRALATLGMRLAGPVVWMKAIWDLGERLDRKFRKTTKNRP